MSPSELSYYVSVELATQLAVTIIGIIQLARGQASTSFTGDIFAGSSTSPSEYALAFYSGLWAYDGWDQANYVGGEMKNATKNIPRAIHSSMIIVTVRTRDRVKFHLRSQTRSGIICNGECFIFRGFGQGMYSPYSSRMLC